MKLLRIKEEIASKKKYDLMLIHKICRGIWTTIVKPYCFPFETFFLRGKLLAWDQYCHKWRDGLKQNVTKSATIVDKGSKKDENVVMQAPLVMVIEPQGF